ncbi:12765_t:CDS:2 [Ambispora gerdemannii]|uniref:12765_t:CDS:1 n=1 Tax=Ambispora gerdemannii TaxID=144530 RepID=A0A9N9CFB3_9GLOM|nr:12765_t:CDS:2 [Ambispora gerdemannii]
MSKELNENILFVVVKEESYSINAMTYEGTFAITHSIETTENLNLNVIIVVHKKAQSWWDTLSSSEREKELARVVENMKLGKYWANNVKEGEASASTSDVPIQIAEEFMEREFGKVDLALVLRKDYQIIKKDGNDDKENSPPNLASSQSLTNSNGKSDNPVNSPNSNPEPDQSPASSIKTIKFENKEDDDNNNPTDPVEKSSNKKLVINLRDIKQITLTPDGNLVIEFNKSENNNSQETQIITDQQINSSQELQTVKNYLQKSKQKSASQQELNNILNTNSNTTEKPKDNSNILLVVGIGGALTIGLLIGLFIRRKRKVGKN